MRRKKHDERGPTGVHACMHDAGQRRGSLLVGWLLEYGKGIHHPSMRANILDRGGSWENVDSAWRGIDIGQGTQAKEWARGFRH